MENSEKIGFVIIVACVVILFFILIVAIVTLIYKRKIQKKENNIRLFEKQKQLDMQLLEEQKKIELFKAVMNAEQIQKAKIAANLHDDIIMDIKLKAMNLFNTANDLALMGVDVDTLKIQIDSIAAVSDKVREISYDLSNNSISTNGLISSIEEYIEQLDNVNSSEASFKNDTNYKKDLPISRANQIAIYMVSKEILNNLFKHAHYSILIVTLTGLPEFFTLEFLHNGKSITKEKINELRESNAGMGLKTIETRALFLNADIDYIEDGEVSYVILKIPLNDENKN